MQQPVYYSKRLPQVQKPEWKPSKTLLFISVAIFSVIIFNGYIPQRGRIKSPLGSFSKAVLSAITKQYPVTSRDQNSAQLALMVESQLFQSLGNYGIVIKNLSNGESYYSNEHKKFETGSLYKLWVMGAVYEQISKGSLKMDDIVAGSTGNLNTPDASNSGEVLNSPPLTVKDALYKMITVSDNNSAILLTQKAGVKNIVEFMQEYNFSESSFGNATSLPQTTADDMALFFLTLYRGQMVSKDASQAMLNLLKQQKINGKIPKYLPDNLSVAHKTGELDEFSHDAGIVYDTRSNYIIVVLTQSNSRSQADERIAAIAQGVYTYFTPANNAKTASKNSNMP